MKVMKTCILRATEGVNQTMVVPVVVVPSLLTAASGPRVQLGLTVRSWSSLWVNKDLKAGRDAVEGLNRPLFLPPCQK